MGMSPRPQENIMVIQDNSTRSQDMYFILIDWVWAELKHRKMKCPRCWSVLRAIHVTGRDFALNETESQYLTNRFLAA